MVVRLFHPWIGGTERQAHQLARQLIREGYDVRLVTGWWFRGTPQQETYKGVPVFRNHTLWEFCGLKGLRKFGGYLYIFSLIWHLWRYRETYDVIHVHGLNYHTFAAVTAGRWSRRPTLTKLANSGPASDIQKLRQSRQLALARFMLPGALRSDRFVALNKAVVRELLAEDVPSNRIVEIPNGVEVDAFETRLDYTLGTPAKLLFVGRLHPQKCLDSLIRAFGKLLPSIDRPLRLQLLGDGPTERQLRDLAADLGLADKIDFLGTTDDVQQFLRQADVFVLPSRAEGLSNALLEAMSCGLPVVATRIPGNLDAITDNTSGLLCEVNDPDSLAAALNRLLVDESLRARLGSGARERVQERYSLPSVAERYAELYRELLRPPDDRTR